MLSNHSCSQRRRWFSVAVLVVVCLALGAVVYAASFITPLTGPVWNDGANTYDFTVCSNTSPSDNICMEYDVNNSGSFTALSCSFTSFNTCTGSGGTGSTWTCTAPEVANATPFRYQFFRADSGGCSSNRSLFTGFQTFNTGPTAVSLVSLSATKPAGPLQAALAPLAVVVALAALLAGAFLWRRRQVAQIR